MKKNLLLFNKKYQERLRLDVVEMSLLEILQNDKFALQLRASVQYKMRRIRTWVSQ